jgi:hypothetical protein
MGIHTSLFPSSFGVNTLGNSQGITVKNEHIAPQSKVCGYSILKAENSKDAMILKNDHPHINGWSDQCSIELHEVLPMN